MKRRRKKARKFTGVKPPLIFRAFFLEKIWKWLCWITNNELHPKHETEFDVFFFIVNTLTLIGGSYYFMMAGKETAPFVCLLVIEFTWSLDTLRNNREYLK